MEQLKYFFNIFLSIPLFPILIYQGKQIRNTIPRLPEASHPTGTAGSVNPPLHLLCLGESTIAGVGVKKHEQGLGGHLANFISQHFQCCVEWQVVARSGYTAGKTHERLLPKINSKHLDIIVIGLGGNDTFKLTPPNKWKRDLELLIRDLKKQYPTAAIVFCNVPPIRDFPAFTGTMRLVLGRQIDLLHRILKKVVQKQERVWYVSERIELKDWLEYFKEQKYTAQDFFSDGVHPSELTYKTWASEVAKFIIQENILVIPKSSQKQ